MYIRDPHLLILCLEVWYLSALWFKGHISGAIYVDLLHKCCNKGPLFIGRLSYIHLTTVSALLSPLCCFRFFKAPLSAQGRWKGMREQDLWIKAVIINIQEQRCRGCRAALVPPLQCTTSQSYTTPSCLSDQDGHKNAPLQLANTGHVFKICSSLFGACFFFFSLKQPC